VSVASTQPAIATGGCTTSDQAGSRPDFCRGGGNHPGGSHRRPPRSAEPLHRAESGPRHGPGPARRRGECLPDRGRADHPTTGLGCQDVIYVYDTTAKIKKADGSPVWPVKAAAAEWAKGNPVDFRYTTTGCPKNSQCVIIKQSELASPTVGVTSIATVGTDIKAVTIVLDTTFGRTNSATKRRNVTCHELGHSLGLKHRTASSSCLVSYVTTAKYPDSTDLKNLNTMYGSR
jgi:hypothetical protein